MSRTVRTAARAGASVGSNPVADLMMVVIPRSILKGPNIGLACRAAWDEAVAAEGETT